MRGTEVILRDLSVGYAGRVLVDGANVVFSAGTLTALTGRNGSGKSTLLRAMAGIEKPLAGEILVKDDGDEGADGEAVPLPTMSPRRLARTVSLVTTERIRVTNLKVRDAVALGRTPYTDWTGRLTTADRAAADEALELVDMRAFAEKPLDKLSDGEAQRVMIARAVAQDTPVVLLDEPTAFLDFAARREVCELLARLAHEKGKTVIFSSHELTLVTEFADRELRIGEEGGYFLNKKSAYLFA